MARLGAAGEALRAAVSRWPFGVGRHRIPGMLGAALRRRDEPLVEARGPGGVVLPFLSEDLPHPAFWGLYERGVRRVLRESLRPGDAFVDLGAHRGFHTGLGLSLVGPTGLVVAVEPLPGNLECLRRLASLNPGRRLEVIAAAAAREPGEAQLRVAEHAMLSSIARRGAVPEGTTVLPVSAVTLDGIWERYLRDGPPERRVTVKIDVEGAEEDVLAGGAAALADRARLRTLVVECAGGMRPQARARSLGMADLLRNAGFEIRALDKDGDARPWTDADSEKSLYLLATR